MIKLRLRRMGAKKQPSYRIVAAESRKPRDGRFIEIIGHYDPKTDPYTLRVNEDRAKYWLDNGAQPTETVRALLVKSGVLPGYQGPETTGKAAPASKASASSEAAAEPAEEPQAEAEPEPEPEPEPEAAEVAEEEAAGEAESSDKENS